MRRFAISDIHGCLETFRQMVENQLRLKPDDQLYILGDCVDRGPSSKGVLDYIMQLDASGYQVYCIKGNHEEMMINANRTYEEEVLELWLYNGGRETLASFGITDPRSLPSRYIHFMDNFQPYITLDNLILVHAGLNFMGETMDPDGDQFLWKLHNPLNDYQSMMWIRDWYDDVDWNWLKDRRIVHGHTPIVREDIQDMALHFDEDQIIDIDNGCFAKFHDGLGNLCALDLHSYEVQFLPNLEFAS